MSLNVDSATVDQYRFDDAYNIVYEFIGDAYVYLCSYYSAGITCSNRELTKIRKVKEWTEECNLLESADEI